MARYALPMLPHDPALRLERLRQGRVRPDQDQSLQGLLAPIAQECASAARRADGAGELWAALCPAHLLMRTNVRGVTRGVLTIAANDAATRYELDRWLRGGGEEGIIRASASPIRRVKIVPGDFPQGILGANERGPRQLGEAP